MAWRIAEEVGYEPLTTFWDDFSIAEKFGKNAIKDTAERVFKEWKHDYKYLTELIMVINHKCWEHNNTNQVLSDLYGQLYYEYDEKAIRYLEQSKNQEGLTYYFRTLD